MLQASNLATITKAYSGELLWQGPPETLDTEFRMRASDSEPLQGVSREKFDKVVSITTPRKGDKMEQIRKDFVHERHLLRRKLHQNTSFLQELVEPLIKYRNVFETAEIVGEKLPDIKQHLVSMATRLQVPQTWPSLVEEAVRGAVYEIQMNSTSKTNMTIDLMTVPEVLRMMRESEHRREKMLQKKAIFLLGNTGSGKSTMASYMMNLA